MWNAAVRNVAAATAKRACAASPWIARRNFTTCRSQLGKREDEHHKQSSWHESHGAPLFAMMGAMGLFGKQSVGASDEDQEVVALLKEADAMYDAGTQSVCVFLQNLKCAGVCLHRTHLHAHIHAYAHTHRPRCPRPLM